MGNVNLILIFTAPSGLFPIHAEAAHIWRPVLAEHSKCRRDLSRMDRQRPGGGAVYPVKVSANNRYLVDQNNAPFLIMGDCPQSLTVNLSVAQTDSYFSNRQAHGFNTMWINLVCTVYTGRTAGRQHLRRDASIHGIPSGRPRSVAFRPLQTQ